MQWKCFEDCPKTKPRKPNTACKSGFTAAACSSLCPRVCKWYRHLASSKSGTILVCVVVISLGDKTPRVHFGDSCLRRRLAFCTQRKPAKERLPDLLIDLPLLSLHCGREPESPDGSHADVVKPANSTQNGSTTWRLKPQLSFGDGVVLCTLLSRDLPAMWRQKFSVTTTEPWKNPDAHLVSSSVQMEKNKGENYFLFMTHL